MNFHWPFFRKADPAPAGEIERDHRTGQFIPSVHERKRRANEASVKMQLAILTARLSDDERAAAKMRAAVRTPAIERGRAA